MNISSSNNFVTLYVVPGCPLCADARAWLERHDVRYAERDVARDFGALRAMYRLTGQRLVPVFERDGRALVRPPDADLRKFLLDWAMRFSRMQLIGALLLLLLIWLVIIFRSFFPRA